MKKLITYSFLFAASFLHAQDYHVSHYDVASLYLNPATTGFYGAERADYKIYLDQRSQWRSIGVKPFMTSYIAYDKIAPYKGKNFGLGGFLINNNGGIGNFNTLTFMLSGAYDILNSGMDKKTTGRVNIKHQLTVGLQAGIFYRSTNSNALNYDVQYVPTTNGGFDQSIPNNEPYNGLNLLRFDANYGIFYKYLERGKKIHPFLGLSLAHLTRPHESLTGGDSRLPIKWTGHAGADLKLNDKLDLTPRALFLYQSQSTEFSAGILLYYRLTDNDTKLLAGVDYRINDAVIINLGLKHESYAIRFSYDINNSYLENYTRGRGAYEISLIFIGEKGKPLFRDLTKF